MKWSFKFRRANNAHQFYVDITVDDVITIFGASLFTDGPAPPRVVMPTRPGDQGARYPVVKLSASAYAEMEAALLKEYALQKSRLV